MRSLLLSLLLCGVPASAQWARIGTHDRHEVAPTLGHPDAPMSYAPIQVVRATDGFGLVILVGGQIEYRIQVPVPMPKDPGAQFRVNEAWRRACHPGLSIIMYWDGSEPQAGSDGVMVGWPVFNTAECPGERWLTPIHALVAQGIMGIDPRTVPQPLRTSMRDVLYETVRDGAGYWADVRERGQELWIVAQSGLTFRPYTTQGGR